MSSGSSIEWTNATWNPVSGCTRVSAGCDHCYAVTMTNRLAGMGQEKYAGLTVLNRKGERHFNGTVRCHEEALTIPLGWRKPRLVFVNSMSDLFHRDVPFEFIDRVFAVMALCPHHTFQVLTKRPERMAEYLDDPEARTLGIIEAMEPIVGKGAPWAGKGLTKAIGGRDEFLPLPNVWLMTSVENQEQADIRIPHLLRCPAAVRGLSCEPLLGPVDITPWLEWGAKGPPWLHHAPNPPVYDLTAHGYGTEQDQPERAWVIAGGESGPGARPCDVAWIRSIVEQCRAAGVPCFVKQVQVWRCPECGNCWPDRPEWPAEECDVCADRSRRVISKNPSEWPADLRVREFPTMESTHAE